MGRFLAFVLILGLIGSWSGNAEALHRTIVGSWFLDVTPQPVLPEFPEPPPPFVAIFNFGLAKTVTETDSSIHPNSMVLLFPSLPPLSASDGYGTWKRMGRNRFKCTFIKILFDDSGDQLGFFNTTLKIVVNRNGTLEGEGKSDFILGSDPDGDVFFTGPVTFEGSRLRVED